MCKTAVKNLGFVIRYVLNKYKTQTMCDKVFLENWGALVCSLQLEKSKNVQ